MLYSARQARPVRNGVIARKGRRPKEKRHIQLQILQGLPGVGPARTQSLLEKYGNVESLIQADYEGLMDIPGIGKNAAQRIRWVVSEPAALYALTTDKQLISPT